MLLILASPRSHVSRTALLGLLLCSLLIPAFAGRAFAALPPVDVARPLDQFLLTPHLEVLEDPDGSLALDQARTAAGWRPGSG